MKVRTALLRKCFSMKELKDYSDDLPTKLHDVTSVINLSTEQYREFTENLSKDYIWLTNQAGILIVTDGENKIAVDTQGYSYARYIGLVQEII